MDPFSQLAAPQIESARSRTRKPPHTEMNVLSHKDTCSDSSTQEELLKTSPQKPPLSTRVGNALVFAICWFDVLVLACAISNLGPFYPNEAGQRGVTPTVIGAILSATPFCIATLSPFFGYYASSIGVRFMLLMGSFASGVSFSLFGLVTMISADGGLFVAMCFILRIFQGTAVAMFTTASFALVIALYPDNIGLVMGLTEVASAMGFAIGPPVGSGLYVVGGFKLPFLVTGILPILSLVPLYLILQQNTSLEISVEKLSARAVWRLLRSFRMLCIVLCCVLALAAVGFFVSTLSPFMVQQFHVSVVQVGFAFLAGPGIYMVAALCVGPLSDKFGSRPFIICGLLISGVGFFFVGPAFSTPKLWLTILSFAVIGFGSALAYVPTCSDLLNIAKSLDTGYSSDTLSTVISGIIVSALSCGELIGPFIGGLLTDHLDFQTSAVIFGEVLLAHGILVLLLTLFERYLVKLK